MSPLRRVFQYQKTAILSVFQQLAQGFVQIHTRGSTAWK